MRRSTLFPLLKRSMRAVFLMLCIGFTLMESGCMSARMTTDLKPEKDPVLKASAGTFYVAELTFSADNLSQQTAETYKKYQRELLPLLRKECLERYPALFTDDSSGAIPLKIDVGSTTAMHTLKTIGWLYGTLLISGVILPCPGDSDEDIDMRVGVWTGRENLRSATLQKSFRREIHTWVSLLTPAALITIPGESDFPKVSGSLFNMQGMEKVYLQQLASQIATALAKTVVTKDAEYWTAQPRWTAPVSGSPGLNPSPVSAPLTLPTQTVAPF